MKYIVLDMEWDSSFFPPEKKFINQILQIGAVKLDENFNIIDTFEVIVRSSFSKRVSKRFTELTGITKEMVLSGKPLEKAVEMYNDFVGDNSITMTWSDSDLYTIIENEKLLLKDKRFRFDRYLDLQKYVQNELSLMGYESSSQISLANAAALLDIETDNIDFHTAKDDCTVCALILKNCYNKDRFEKYIKNANTQEFYDRFCFKSFYISDINSPDIPRSAFVFKCEKCGGELTEKGKWNYHNRSFSNALYCPDCGIKYIGRVSARKTYDNVKIKSKLFIKKTKEEKQDEMQPLSQKV